MAGAVYGLILNLVNRTTGRAFVVESLHSLSGEEGWRPSYGSVDVPSRQAATCDKVLAVFSISLTLM